MSGTQFLIVPGAVTTVRVVWTPVENAAHGTTPDSVNGFAAPAAASSPRRRA